LKEPVKLEINREERERIERIEEKLDIVDRQTAGMSQRTFTPLSKTPWKTATEVSFALIKEAAVIAVRPTETPPPLNTVVSPVRKIVHKKQVSRAVTSYVQQQNAVLQSIAK
jgi:hypothetical protein